MLPGVNAPVEGLCYHLQVTISIQVTDGRRRRETVPTSIRVFSIPCSCPEFVNAWLWPTRNHRKRPGLVIGIDQHPTITVNCRTAAGCDHNFQVPISIQVCNGRGRDLGLVRRLARARAPAAFKSSVVCRDQTTDQDEPL